MTAKTLALAIKKKKPAIILEKGLPRYVVLDWETYRGWEEMREDIEDHVRFEFAEQESLGRKRFALADVKKRYALR
ncbi:MAG: hypothetical protein Q8R35_02745 [bacterium]|nr:hypothetical protein [bacterium]